MKKILIVDDSQIMRNMLKDSFSALNIPCQYIEAENGREAFFALEDSDIDLVFLDWNMPQLSGLDFVKKTRLIKKFDNLPIVMVTSEAANYNVIEALKSGVTAYLVKPICSEKFAKTVATLNF